MPASAPDEVRKLVVVLEHLLAEAGFSARVQAWQSARGPLGSYGPWRFQFAVEGSEVGVLAEALVEYYGIEVPAPR